MKHNISHIQDAYEKYLTLSFNLASATPNKWVDAAGLKEKVGGFGFSKMKTIFFESTTSWVAPVTGVVIVIAIGGGGGGGGGAASGGSSYAPSGGGGGSGHISIGTANVIKNTSYPITVGAGGKPGIKNDTVNSPTAGAPGSDGGFSSALSITAAGGSGGGAATPDRGGNGGNGGSGGGGGSASTAYGSSITMYYGGNGGNGSFGGGGGGGIAYSNIGQKGTGGNGGNGGPYGGGGGAGGGAGGVNLGKSGSGGKYGGAGGSNRQNPTGHDGTMFVNNIINDVFCLEMLYPKGGDSGINKNTNYTTDYGLGGGGGCGTPGGYAEENWGGAGGGGIGALTFNISHYNAFSGGSGGNVESRYSGTGGGTGGDGVPFLLAYENTSSVSLIYKGSGGKGCAGNKSIFSTTDIAETHGSDGLITICYWEE